MGPDPRPRSYAYEHRDGVRVVAWGEFDQLCDGLTEAVADHEPEMVVGVTRGGLLPAATIASRLRLDLHPVRLTRRERDRVVRRSPQWKVTIPGEVAGRSVLIVDDVADTGETLAMVRRHAEELGAGPIVLAALVAHTWAQPFPEAVGLVTDALVVLPWNRRVWQRGRWVAHPELAAALDGREG